MADYTAAQQAVLGSMLIDETCVGRVVATLRPEDFAFAAYRDVFEAIRTLYADGKPVDLVTALARMDGADSSRQKLLLELMDVTPTAANVDEYIRIVREQSVSRAVREMAEQLARAETPEEQRVLAAGIREALDGREAVRPMGMAKGLQRFYERLQREPEYLRWGFPFLDEGIFCETGNLVVLGGRPSDGKTALALQMAYAQSRDKRVGFFSFETDSDTLFSRVFGAAAGVDKGRIQRRTLTQEDYKALAETSKEMLKHGLWHIQAAGMTAEDVRLYTQSHRYEVIYVDYLQIINAPEQDGPVARVSYISRKLHELAQGLNVTVVALSQLSRQTQEQQKAGPRMQALRESGQIEQDADVILMLARDPKEKPEKGQHVFRRRLSLVKNKEGRLAEWDLLFDGATQRFSEQPQNVAKALRESGERIKQTNRARAAQTDFAELTVQDEDLPF